MDKSERAHLLRACYRAKRPAKPQEARKPRLVEPKPRGWFNWSANNAAFGDISKEYGAAWVVAPDAKPATGPKPQRTKKPSPLTRISQQLPKKLPRVLFDL